MCVMALVYLVVCRYKKMELFSFIAFEKAKNIGAIMDESYSWCFIRLIYISYKLQDMHNVGEYPFVYSC